MQIILGITIPFIGTTLGSAMVFFMKKHINKKVEKLLLGFSAGIMISASVWSLIIPSIELSKRGYIIPWLPSTIGFIIGILFLILANNLSKKLTIFKEKSNMRNTIMLIFAVTIHNIPEGMAVGIAIAGAISNNNLITMASAITLAIGISIQNFPEGAIISLPLKSKGISKIKSFYYGTLSGIVEPISSIITLVLSNFIRKLLPYLLSFAAGAMMFVVAYDLIPEAKDKENSYFGILGITIGFLIMMILDISLG